MKSQIEKKYESLEWVRASKFNTLSTEQVKTVKEVISRKERQEEKWWMINEFLSFMKKRQEKRYSMCGYKKYQKFMQA